MCQCVGVGVVLPDGRVELLLEPDISVGARLSIENAFVERTRNMIAAYRARHVDDSVGWLERLAQLPDGRD